MTTTAFGTPLLPVQYESVSIATSPRALAKINGSAFPILNYEIEFNAHGSTDSARFDLTLSDKSDWTIDLFATGLFNPVVEIWAGFPSNPISWDLNPSTSGLQRRFVGGLDQYSLNLREDTGTFSVRSLAAPLLDNKVTTLVQNLTSQQFVQYWAAQYNLKPVFVVPPGYQYVTLAQVYGREFIVGVKSMGIWDVMEQCAQWDGVDVWVDQQTLYYAATSLIQRNLLDLKYGRDLLDLTFTHSIQYSKRIRVEVRSYVPKTRTSTSVRSQTNDLGGADQTTTTRVVNSTPIFGTKNSVVTSISSNGSVTVTDNQASGGSTSATATQASGESSIQRYPYWFPNLTVDQCKARANELWREISMHEYAVTLRVPVTPSKFPQLSITTLVRLHGTPYRKLESTDKATSFYPRRVTESFDPNAGAGWTWTIDALNHPLALGQV